MNKINKSNFKVLINNFLSLSFLQVANYVFPLITLPYLTYVLGVEIYGKLAFCQAVIIWFQAVVDYGFVFSSVRDIARCRDDIQKVSNIFSDVMWARLLLTAISFLILLILIFLFKEFRENSLLLILTFLVVVGHAIFPEWLFQGLERMKYITILNVSTKLFFTLSIFIFIKDSSDFYFQPLLLSLGYIVAGIISLHIISTWKIKFRKPNIKHILNAIKSNTDLFINLIVPNFYSNFSIVLLGFIYGEGANGILDIGRKFNIVAISLLMIISRVFYPYLSRDIKKHALYAKLTLTTSIVLFILIFFLAPPIINLFFTDQFSQSIPVLRILSFSLINQALINVYGTNYLIVKGYEKEVRNATVLASLIGFVIAYPLVLHYSYIGVAVLVTFSTSLMALFIILQYNKKKKYEINKNNKENIH